MQFFDSSSRGWFLDRPYNGSFANNCHKTRTNVTLFFYLLFYHSMEYHAHLRQLRRAQFQNRAEPSHCKFSKSSFEPSRAHELFSARVLPHKHSTGLSCLKMYKYTLLCNAIRNCILGIHSSFLSFSYLRHKCLLLKMTEQTFLAIYVRKNGAV